MTIMLGSPVPPIKHHEQQPLAKHPLAIPRASHTVEIKTATNFATRRVIDDVTLAL